MKKLLFILFFITGVAFGQPEYEYTKGAPYHHLSPRELALVEQLAFGMDKGSPDSRQVRSYVTRYEGTVEIYVSGASADELRSVKWAAYRFSVLTFPTASFVLSDNPDSPIKVHFGTISQGESFLGMRLNYRVEGTTINWHRGYLRTETQIFVKKGSGSNTIVHELGHAVSFTGDTNENDGIWSDREVIPKFCSPVEQVMILALYHYSSIGDSKDTFMQSVTKVSEDLFIKRFEMLQKTIAK